MAEFGEKALVHLTGMLDDGREFQNTRMSGEPVVVTIGAGKLVPGVEQALLDMLPGDSRTVRLEPGQAYGAYDESLVQRVPAALIPNAGDLPVGNYIDLRTSAGAVRAKVVSADADEVVLDCNSELAGKSVTFDVELLRIVHDSAVHRELHPAGCACGCDKLKQQIG